MLEACFSAAQGLSGQRRLLIGFRCERSRVRTPSGGFHHFRIHECQQDLGEKCWNPKHLRILQNAYLRQTTRHVAFTRSKEITGSTQTRSIRSSRPAVGVAAGYCCRIAAPPRQRRRQREHGSCVRACVRVCWQVHIHDYENWQWQPARLEPLHRESTRVKRGIIERLFKTSCPHRLSPRAVRGNPTRVRVVVFIDKKHSSNWNHFITQREKLVEFRTDCVRRGKSVLRLSKLFVQAG